MTDMSTVDIEALEAGPEADELIGATAAQFLGVSFKAARYSEDANAAGYLAVVAAMNDCGVNFSPYHEGRYGCWVTLTFLLSPFQSVHTSVTDGAPTYMLALGKALLRAQALKATAPKPAHDTVVARPERP